MSFKKGSSTKRSVLWRAEAEERVQGKWEVCWERVMRAAAVAERVGFAPNLALNYFPHLMQPKLSSM